MVRPPGGDAADARVGRGEMCGIAGSLGRLKHDPARSDAILAALRHRGPDKAGVKEFETASLLHTRLRIIDLTEAGDQPMSNEDGSVWVVFNGEIYNHRALRRELEAAGHRFRGRSDTEVLPHLYEEYGTGMFARLRGMFTVAVLDLRAQRLLLGRDRFGIKPLFYAQGERFVAFASELRALDPFPGVDRRIDRQAVADYAALLFIPAPATIYRGVRALCPGELLDCRLDGDRVIGRTSRYHRFEIAPDEELSYPAAVAEAERLIEQAVGRQFESDVPLGALLSGGIDSSLVSAFGMRRRGDEGLLTFNVRMPDRAVDETWAAQAVADEIGSAHRTLELDGGSGSWDHVTTVLRQAGQPYADTSLFAADAVSAAMRDHVTVALSGDGGDEGFGGYDAYWQLGVIERLQRIPAFAWRGAARVVAPLSRAGIAPPTLARRIRDVAGADDAGVLQALYCWIREAEHRELLAEPSEAAHTRRLFEPQWEHAHRRDAQRVERLSSHAVEINVRLILANDYLAKVDTASMRHALEIRVPMLDEDLIAYGFRLPHRLRVHGKTGKRVLRGVAAHHLPRAVVERPKQGFSVPVDRWVGDAAKASIREQLLGPSSRLTEHFDRPVYAPWVEAFHDGHAVEGISRGGLYQRVMMLLALDLALDGRPAAA